ncbi:MAG: indole-3-glycerol phosphate synthase TrpC [Anaerolineae bacterium]|nr:indole-3-glycerol phosphate synthase TrpC [Anaerolineae bacterium]
MAKTILDEIIAWKRIEVEQHKQVRSPAQVQAEAAQAMPPRDFAAALCTTGKVALIAEIKRASPSKGAICPDLDPVDLARTYAANGAAAISVLTDGKYFGGSLDDLRAVRQAVDIPVLRKEFVVDPYQVYEARAAGADAVLLIVAVLEDDELARLYALAGELGMVALVEVHNEAELACVLPIRPRIIGVNNRDLMTFVVDLATTARLRPLVPADTLLVAESGIHTRADADRLGEIGVNAMLVGESLVRAEDVRRQVRELVGA